MIRTTVAAASLGLALFLGGCAANDHPKEIPLSALRTTEGDGTISYTAAHDGMAYVYDRGSDRIVWSGPVAAEQTITVDPSADKIRIGDRVAAEDVLHADHQHEIYFHEQAIPGQKVIVQKKETIIEHPRP